MNKFDYAYAVAYIRAIENKLLSGSEIESLIASKSASDALKILSDKGYGTPPAEPESFETLLSERMSRAWEDVNFAAPPGASLDILLYKNDFHNMKAALKGVPTGVKDYAPYVLSPGTVDLELMISSVIKADFSILPEMLAPCAAEAYDVLSRTGDSQLCDVIIDRACMDYTLKTAVGSHNEFLKGYISLLNTLSDIKTALRSALTSKSADFMERAVSGGFLPDREELIKAALGGVQDLSEFLRKSGYSELSDAMDISAEEFEKASERAVAEYIKKSASVTFGIEPLISYIYKMQLEIQNVRIILSGKLNDFSEGQIRDKISVFAR